MFRSVSRVARAVTAFGVFAALVSPGGLAQADDTGPISDATSILAMVAEDDPAYTVADLLIEAGQLHPDVVAALDVELESLGPVGEQTVLAKTMLDGATERLADAESARSAIQIDIVQTRREMRVAVRVVGEAQVLEGLAEEALALVAVQTFIELEDAALDRSGSGAAGSNSETVARNTREQAGEQLVVATGAREDAEAVLAALGATLADLQAGALAQDVAAEAAVVDQSLAMTQLVELQPEFERAVLLATVTNTDIPVVVFDAYYWAERTLAEEKASCEVRWDQLAGIGKVESSHGSFGGNVVQSNGRTDGQILGPVLDGEVFSQIIDTDGGRLDGDTEWDRAVGPMQFIPGSWSIYGRDGNDDGNEDPHNLYDAALAAGGHLCGTTHGLSENSNFRHALLGYNQSPPYGVAVMGFAESYLEAVGEIEPLPTEGELLELDEATLDEAPLNFGEAEFDWNSPTIGAIPS